MSAVTLETLKADFDRELAEFATEGELQHADNPSWKVSYVGYEIAAFVTPDAASRGRFQVAIRFDATAHLRKFGPCLIPTNLRDSARLYVIARDFGEFDRDRALMLWKLQNG